MSTEYGKMKFARIEDYMLVDGHEKPVKAEAVDDLYFTDPSHLNGPHFRITVMVEEFADPDLHHRSSAQTGITMLDLEDHLFPPDVALEDLARVAFQVALRNLRK